MASQRRRTPALLEDSSDEDEAQPTSPPVREFTTAGIVDAVIKEQLHTDQISADAALRVSGIPIPKDFALATGASQARANGNWMYGVNRRAVAPLRSGLNFSYNALVKGTGVDERALPKFLQMRHQTSTEEIVHKRRTRPPREPEAEYSQPLAIRKHREPR